MRFKFDPSLLTQCHDISEITMAEVHFKKAHPPNFEAITKVFPAATKPSVIFAYEDTIYVPSGEQPGPAIVAHEVTHLIQQKKVGGAEAWWALYLAQPEFRFLAEMDAHRIEYRNFIANSNHNRHERRRYFKLVAEKLSGPLYNHFVTRGTAERYIETEIDHDTANRQRGPEEYTDVHGPIEVFP